MPRDFGRAGRPLDARHCSRRELRGPCVDIRVSADADAEEEPAPESRSIVSVLFYVFSGVVRFVESKKGHRRVVRRIRCRGSDGEYSEMDEWIATGATGGRR